MLLDWKKMMEGTGEVIGTLAKGNPELLQGLETLGGAGSKKGALDNKTRELICLAVAATTRCDGCISIHAAEAVKAGATRDELLEAMALAVAMNAGAATVYAARIVEAFDQFKAK